VSHQGFPHRDNRGRRVAGDVVAGLSVPVDPSAGLSREWCSGWDVGWSEELTEGSLSGLSL